MCGTTIVVLFLMAVFTAKSVFSIALVQILARTSFLKVSELPEPASVIISIGA